MIKEAYCSFEVAKLLKGKGFNEECIGAYPTHQMAMSWLREKYNIIVVIKPATFSGDNCTSWAFELWCGGNFEAEITIFKTYEEAVEVAL